MVKVDIETANKVSSALNYYSAVLRQNAEILSQVANLYSTEFELTDDLCAEFSENLSKVINNANTLGTFVMELDKVSDKIRENTRGKDMYLSDETRTKGFDAVNKVKNKTENLANHIRQLQGIFQNPVPIDDNIIADYEQLWFDIFEDYKNLATSLKILHDETIALLKDGNDK